MELSVSSGRPQVCQKNASRAATTGRAVRGQPPPRMRGASDARGRMTALQRECSWPLRWAGPVCTLVLWVTPIQAATLAPVPAVHEIDWRTSPLDLNLRGLNGERFRFRCPPGKAAPGQVVGSGPYTDGSSICVAGVHAGVIRAARGGLVTIEVRPGELHYAASLSHYVQTEAYETFWSGSFL